MVGDVGGDFSQTRCEETPHRSIPSRRLWQSTKGYG